MSNMLTAVIFVISLNVFMFMAQASMTGLYPSSNTFCNVDSTLIGNYTTTSNGTMTMRFNGTEWIPDVATTVSAGGLLSFIDSINTIIDGVKQKIDLFLYVLKAPACLLSQLLPNNMYIPLLVLWYIVSGLVLFGYIIGREN